MQTSGKKKNSENKMCTKEGTSPCGLGLGIICKEHPKAKTIQSSQTWLIDSVRKTNAMEMDPRVPENHALHKAYPCPCPAPHEISHTVSQVAGSDCRYL